MIKLTLIVLFLAIISTSYLQEITNTQNDQLLTNDPNSPLWPLQNYPHQRRKGKPCPRRSNRADEPWIPSFSSKIIHALHEPNVLQPQALKNEEIRNSAVRAGESIQENSPERRSYNTYTSTVPPLNANIDDDCVDQLESTNGDAEETALKIIEDCLRKKQNNKVAETLLGSSRRSMPDLANSAEDNEDTEGALFAGISVPSGREGDVIPDSSRRKSSNNLKDSSSKSENSDKSSNSAPPLGSSLHELRICYACSTATNPSCWHPDKRTTIKYCTREQSCVTKTFGVKNSLTLIRDCANSCKDSTIPGLEPKYKTCDLCHSDYCNSAISINGYNLVIILTISVIKCIY